jgi:CRP-like cAMP-binding protein
VVWPAGAQQILRRTLIEDFAGERIFVNKGRHLSVEGEEAASIFFQLTGWTSVECVSRRGDRVLMDFLLPGDFIGLADEGRYAAFTVTALTDVAALRVERTQFQALCETDPEFPQVYIKALRDSLLRTRNRRLALSAKSSAAKVCEVLSELASRTEIAMKDVPSPRLPITQVSLACAIGLTPVAVNRIVQSLRRAGVLDWGVAGVRILDQRRLREFE